MTKNNFGTRSVFFLALALSAAQIRAGSVDNRNNNSADYIRSLSRNAATEGADASIYNPAGTVRFSDGLHLSIDNQTVSKFNRHSLNIYDVSYKSDIVSPLYPTAFAVYKRAAWSAFSAFSFPGGGGELEYKQGSATALPIEFNLRNFTPPRDADVYLRSIYYGFTLGGAYAFGDKVSVSLALRAAYARTDVSIDADTVLNGSSSLIDHMEEARGATAVLGVDWFPMPALVLALRVEGPTSLQWEVQKSNLNLDQALKDPNLRQQYVAGVRQVLRAPGQKFQRDLPAVVGLGAGYTLNPQLRADLSFNYYLNTWADWGGAENSHDDGWETSLGLEYRWPTIPLRTSVGAQYTVTGANSASYSIENPALNSYTLGLGGRYDFTGRLGLSAGFAGNFAFDDSAPVASLITPNGKIPVAQLEKHVLVYALGLEYRFF
jgi:long-chain fatty acid transport protein